MKEYFINIINLVLIFVSAVLLSLYAYIKAKMRKSSRNKMNTYFIIDKVIGFLLSIFSKIRKGKSSTGNAIINTKEIQLMQKCNGRMEEIISLFPKVDFYIINRIIDSLALNDEVFYSKQEEITKMIVKELDIENRMYNDFIKCKTLYERIEEYIECYYILNYRGIYVYSKTWRYSYVTRLTSKYLTDNTMEVKDIKVNKEFYLRKYSIVFEDELSLTKGNILSHSKAEKDKGRKEIKVLFGQIFQETVYYISIKQRSADEISNEKYLYTNYLYIQDRKVYNDFSLFIKYYTFRNSLWLFKYKVKYIFYVLCHLFRKRKDLDSYLLCKKRYRKKKYYFDTCLRYFNSLAIVDISVRDYDSYDDIGKENTPTHKRYEEYVLTFDLRDTIGNFDTHEFKLLYPVLNALSNVYDSKYNTGYKSKRLVMEQALFLFDKWLKEERKRLDEIDNDDVYEERGIDLNED